MPTFTKSIVGQAAIAWLEVHSYSVCGGDTLAALRDALLPKLISGELRVPDAERMVGRVA